MPINNALLQMAARGGRSAVPEMHARGVRVGNALAQFQQEQERQNALAQISQAYAQGGPQAAVQIAGQTGQFDALRQIDNTIANRRFRNRQLDYRQSRDQASDERFERQFQANQDYRNQTLGLQRQRLSVAEQKAATKAKSKGKPTVDSAKAAGFFERMSASDEILNDPESIEAATSLQEKLIGGIPVAGNFFVTPAFRRYDQAKRDFINAQLRRESGAVISDAEFANAERQYFPQPGDDPSVIAQKAQNRRLAIESNRRAGLPSLGDQATQEASQPKRRKFNIQTGSLE